MGRPAPEISRKLRSEHIKLDIARYNFCLLDTFGNYDRSIYRLDHSTFKYSKYSGGGVNVRGSAIESFGKSLLLLIDFDTRVDLYKCSQIEDIEYCNPYLS